ncbi:MAG: glycosyltransferase, partial [Pseudomonadota bacterium]
MYRQLVVSAVIPALNEENAVGLVVADLRALRDASGKPVVDYVVVCDNGSTDRTAARAAAAGAIVVHASQAGYGHACQVAIDALP